MHPGGQRVGQGALGPHGDETGTLDEQEIGALELETLPTPEIEPGGILIKNTAAAICGSDLHWWAEGRIHNGLARYPQVLCHEPVGEIVELGAGVAEGTYPDRWSPTDHIAWKTGIPGKGHSSPSVWGDHLFAAGDYAAALPLYRQALEIFRAALEEQHPHFALALNNLAYLLADKKGAAKEALPLAERACSDANSRRSSLEPRLRRMIACLPALSIGL